MRHVLHDKSIETVKKEYESTQRKKQESDKKKYKPSVDVNFHRFLNDHTLSLTKRDSLNSSVDCLENIQDMFEEKKRDQELRELSVSDRSSSSSQEDKQKTG